MGKNSEFYQALRNDQKAQGASILANQLFPGTSWYTEGVLGLNARRSTLKAKPLPKGDSEKTKALESFKNFAEAKLEEAPSGKIQFPGGEVAIQEGATLGRKVSLPDGVEVPSWGEEKVKIVFFGHASKLSRNKNEPDERANELLAKMVQAMRIPTEQVAQVLVDDDIVENNEKFNQLLAGIYASKAQFVVSLGAVATNALLGRKEKLTRIHGQFFPIKIHQNNNELEVRLMPLFHPEFLLINPNMKRTAWIDLQKIMQELGISIS